MKPAGLIVAAIAATVPPGPSRAAEVIALVGGTVHPVSGPVIANGTVVVTDGKITAVGAGLAPPQGARVVSVAGKHVYPGYVSADSVLGLTEVAAVAATNDFAEIGETNPNIRAEVALNPDSDLIPVARINGVTSVHAVPRGGAIAGTSAVYHLDGWTYEDMTVRAPVGLHVRWPRMTPERGPFVRQTDAEQKKARDDAIAAIRKAFEDGRAYAAARAAEGQDAIPRHERDVRWEAMLRALRGEIPVFFHAQALGEIRAALRFADEQKIAKLVLVGAADAWRIAEELRARQVAVITGAPTDVPRRRDAAYDESFSLPARLQAAGVRYCIGDSGGTDAAANARNLPYVAAQAIGFGLTRDEALRAITLSAAEVLGIADALGSIEPGKSADLIVADGDPLEILTHVEQVYIAGRPVSMETRQTRLFGKYDAKPRGPKARPRPAEGSR
jgi:imidazolonepropionase-like amidohydrolase